MSTSSSTKNSVIVWEWFDEYHRWKPYPFHVSNKMEVTQAAGTSQMNLGAADNKMAMYDVDFTRNVQIRKGTGKLGIPVPEQIPPPTHYRQAHYFTVKAMCKSLFQTLIVWDSNMTAM